MKERIMSEKELKRVEAVERVLRGEMSIAEMSEMISVSYRHSKRIVSRCREEGLKGLCHRNRGKASKRRYKEKIKREVQKLYKEKCRGWGPTHISDLVKIERLLPKSDSELNKIESKKLSYLFERE